MTQIIAIKTILYIKRVRMNIAIEKNLQQFKTHIIDHATISSILLNNGYTGINDKINKLKKLEKDIIITANLPYILDKDYDNMDKSVIKYEPKIALYWWKNTWFELYEQLVLECLKLKEIHNITLFIEIWFDQYMYSKFFLENLWLKFEYFKDMNNINRLIKIYI